MTQQILFSWHLIVSRHRYLKRMRKTLSTSFHPDNRVKFCWDAHQQQQEGQSYILNFNDERPCCRDRVKDRLNVRVNV